MWHAEHFCGHLDWFAVNAELRVSESKAGQIATNEIDRELLSLPRRQDRTLVVSLGLFIVGTVDQIAERRRSCTFLAAVIPIKENRRVMGKLSEFLRNRFPRFLNNIVQQGA